MTTEQELEHWKHIAAWMAECHAANLHEAELSRTSESSRERFRSIMLKAAGYMTGRDTPRKRLDNGDEAIRKAVERCEDHAAKVPCKKRKD